MNIKYNYGRLKFVTVSFFQYVNKSKGQKHSRLKNGEYLLTGRMQPDGHNKGIQCGVLLFNVQTINTIMFAFRRNRRRLI